MLFFNCYFKFMGGLQLLLKWKLNMYSDIAYYSHPNHSTLFTLPQSINTTQLFDYFSFALERNLNDYLTKKNRHNVQRCQLGFDRQKNINQRQIQIIDLLSQEEIQQENLKNQKQQMYVNLGHLEFQINQIKNNKNMHMEIIKQTQGLSQTSSQVLKKCPQKYYEEQKQIKLLHNLQNKLKIDYDFQIFTIKCPKIGIFNKQLLQKKQSLLSRKVKNWSTLPQKNTKHRREIKMLKH